MEHNILTLDYWQDQVKYEGCPYPSGTLGCAALNIPQEKIAEAALLAPSLQAVILGVPMGMVQKEQLQTAGNNIFQMLDLLREFPPFSLFDNGDFREWIGSLFTEEAAQNALDYIRAGSTVNVNAALQKEYRKGVGCLKVIQIFAQLPWSLSVYQGAILPFAQALHGSGRTAAEYAILFGQTFSDHLDLTPEDPSWMAIANMSAQYFTAVMPGKEDPQIVKRMHYVSFVGMLRSDLFEGLSAGHAPRRCPICGRWFLTTDARRTTYCGGLAPGDPKGRTCRQIGNLRGRASRELADDHPLKAIYERRMDTIRQKVRRGNLEESLAEEMNRLAKNKLQRAIADPKYAKTAYPKEMEQAALKAEAEKLL